MVHATKVWAYCATVAGCWQHLRCVGTPQTKHCFHEFPRNGVDILRLSQPLPNGKWVLCTDFLPVSSGCETCFLELYLYPFHALTTSRDNHHDSLMAWDWVEGYDGLGKQGQSKVNRHSACVSARAIAYRSNWRNVTTVAKSGTPAWGMPSQPHKRALHGPGSCRISVCRSSAGSVFLRVERGLGGVMPQLSGWWNRRVSGKGLQRPHVVRWCCASSGEAGNGMDRYAHYAQGATDRVRRATPEARRIGDVRSGEGGRSGLCTFV